jgi:hypothetical protein
VTPTSSSMSPSAQTISVADGRSETIRISDHTVGRVTRWVVRLV